MGKNVTKETAGLVTGQGNPEAVQDPTKAEDAKGKRFITYDGNQFETRIISAKDFKAINEKSELKQQVWSPTNKHTVEVDETWTDADVEALLKQPGFKLVEN